MSGTHAQPSRAIVPDRFRPAVLGTLLALPLLTMGAVHPVGVLVLALVAAAGLIVLWDRSNPPSPSAVWLPLGVVGVFVGMGLLSLVPLPAAIVSIVSPGTAEALPNAAWQPVAWDASTGWSSWVVWAGLAGIGMMSVFAIGRQPVHGFSGKAAVATVLWIAAANLLHHLMNGIVGWSLWPVGPWAPLVNSNHLATLGVLLGPVCAGTVVRRSSPVPLRWAAAVAALWCLGVVLTSLSAGAYLAAAVIGMGWAARSKRLGPPRWFAVGFLGASVIAGAATLYYAVPEWWAVSVGARWAQWRESINVGVGAPVLGVGPGGYARAYAPYQDFYRQWTYDHAHSDWLEFGLEIGLLGVALAAALVVLTRGSRAARRGGGARWLTLGLLGAAVHALVEFPLHIPGIAVIVLGFAVIRAGVWAQPKRRRSDPWVIGACLALTGVAVVGGAWSYAASRAVEGWTQADEDRSAAAVQVAWLDPTSPIPAIQSALDALDVNDNDLACDRAEAFAQVHSHDAPTQRWAARIQAKAGCLDRALVAAERAAWLMPVDYRPHALQADILRAQGDLTAARDAQAEALKRWPVDLAMSGEPLREALEIFPLSVWWLEQLADAHPAMSLYLGDALVNDEPDVALLAYEQAERGKASYGRWPRRAVAMWATGDREGAHGLLASLTGRDRFAALSIAAQLHEREGDAASAQRKALQALALDPTAEDLRRMVLRLAADDVEALRQVEEQLGFRTDLSTELRVALADRFERLAAYADCRRVLAYASETDSGDEAAVRRDRACHARCPQCSRP